jgi:hypothetical protein
LNGHSNEVIVFAGRGDGWYFPDPAGGVPLPGSLQFVGDFLSLAAADLDGDGGDDLAASAQGSEGIWVAMAGADWIEYPALGGGSLAAGYLDRDGDPDLAVTGTRLGPLGEERADVVLLNRGDGTFEVGAAFPGEGRGPLVAEDFDGDGWADLAMGSGRLLRNRGDGSFEVAATHLPPSGSLAVLDYDDDGREDLVLAAPGGAAVLLNETLPATSRDSNQNGVPDECDVLFHRGDPNSSGTTDISDGIAIFGYLFLGNPATLACRESADANNDGAIDISDGIYLLSWLFTGGPEPATPGPTQSPCGVDPDPTRSAGDLGCDVYAPCQ